MLTVPAVRTQTVTGYISITRVQAFSLHTLSIIQAVLKENETNDQVNHYLRVLGSDPDEVLRSSLGGDALTMLLAGF